MTGGDLERARQLLLSHDSGEHAHEMLYAQWYHACDDRTRIYPPPGTYLAAILDPDRFEAGWTVSKTGLPGLAGCVEIASGSRVRAVAPPFVAPEPAQALVFETGMPVRVFPHAAAQSGGFWHVTSPVWESRGMPERRRRIYFGLADGAECDFASTFTFHADPTVAWSMKCLTGNSQAGRRDGAVAYLPVEASLESGWVAGLLASLTPYVEGDPPPGTRPVVPGISQAPDPEIGRSFGQVLCAALASTGVNAADRDTWSTAARAAVAPVIECTG